MARNLPGDSSQYIRNLTDIHDSEEPDAYAQKWYFSAQEIEELSPSRKDGIREEDESRLRKLYCTFLQELGMELKVPQVTIAASMVMCHRFYMRQSHAKNCWKTIATACMFLGCKVEETPRSLSDVIVVAYKLMYKWDPSAPKRIKQKEVYDKQKGLVTSGEKFLLATLAFNLNLEHPYKPLVQALKRLDPSDNELMKIAWNFVNDWLHTTLCLQYKPHYIAAGSIFLAAKIRKVKLSKEKGKVWWMQFDISPKYLEEVVQQMIRLLEKNKKPAQQPMCDKGNAPKTIAEKIVKSSPESCTSSGAVASTVNVEGLNNSIPVLLKCDQKQGACEVQDSMIVTIPPSSPVTGKVSSGGCQAGTLGGSVVAHSSGVLPSITSVVGLGGPVLSKCNTKEDCGDIPHTPKETKVLCRASDCGSADSIVGECEGQAVKEKSDPNLSCKIVSVEDNNSKIDLDRIRETIRKRKRDRVTNKKLVEEKVNEMDSEAWIERELENGIWVESANTEDKQRKI